MMKRVKTKDDIWLSVGLLIFSTSVFMRSFLGDNTVWLEFLMGLGVGIELVGCVKMIRVKK
jgi:hypothetical protein